MISAFFLAAFVGIVFGKTTMSPTPLLTTSPPQWTDPSVGGRSGNPGARIRLSNKTIDSVHAFAADSIVKAIQSMQLAEFSLPVGRGLLTIKPPRINEIKFADVGNELAPPNLVHSRFAGGRIVASGVWQYKPSIVGRSDAMDGTYKTTIVNAEINTTNQLVRTFDSKPMAQTTRCTTYLGQFHIDIEGAGNLTTIESCVDPICNRIRVFFEDAVCVVVRTFVKEMINRKLATFPARLHVLQPDYKLDYGLLYNEPRVADGWLQAGLEGKFLWRGYGWTPFSPVQCNFLDNQRSLSFELGDYTFNTLLHQAHAQGLRWSAAQMLTHVQSINDQLTLNCTAPIQTTKGYRVKVKSPARKLYGDKAETTGCLGAMFENVTKFGQYARNDTGDLVYKTNQRPSVIVYSSQRAFFDGGNGVLEVYGPAGDKDQRQLLGRADVRMMRGEFMPKFTNGNFTGSIKITTLQLANPSISAPQTRLINDDWLTKLTEFSTPILTEMFNTFFKRFAQFPIPMLEGFECATPKFLISARTMQVDCDIGMTRVSL